MLNNGEFGRKLGFGKVSAVFLCLMLMFSLLMLVPPKAFAAADIWVAPAPVGNDSSPGDGSQAHPYATIGKAYTVAASGDTIKVKAGTYSVGTSSSGFKTTKDNINYVSIDGPYQASILPTDATKEFNIWENWGNNVVIDGFEIDGTGAKARNGLLNQGSYVTVKNNDVHNIMQSFCDSGGGSGINITDYNTTTTSFMVGTVVTANRVHDIGDGTCGYVQSIYISTRATVTNNVVYNNPGGAGIHLWHDAHQVTIVNNTVVDHKFGIVVGATNGTSGGYKACTVESWGCSADNVYVSNNIVQNSNFGTTYGIDLSGTVGSSNTYDYNLINGTTNYWYPTTMTHGTHNITGQNPSFVNSAGHDYKLTSTSPAKDAGITTNAPTVDFDWNTRDSQPDIGAYEYGASGNKSLTFWEKDSEAGSTSTYWFKQALVDGVVVWESDVTADGTAWQSHTVSINPSNPTFTLQFRLISKKAVSNYPISLYVDDVSVSGATITNPDFEGTTGWTYSESTSPFTGAYDTTFHGGAKSYKISYPGSTTSSIGDTASISQSVTSNSRTLIFWEKDSEAGTTSTYWYKQALVDGVVVWESDVTADAMAWQSHTITINPTSSSFTLQFRLISKNGVTNYPISLYVDDVSVSGKTITNADFEGTTGWTYSESVTPFTGAYDTTFHGGTKSYKISYPGSTASSIGDNASISQSL